MFPSLEIEAFYRSQKEGYFLKDEFVDVARLCEEWLMSFDDKEPALQALSILSLGESDYDNRDRMRFAVSMALCIPSQTTGVLVPRYQGYMDENSFDLGSIISGINASLPEEGKVDVLQAFAALPGREFYQTARQAYMVELSTVRLHAVAHDNLDVFRNTLPGDDPKKDVSIALNTLTQFPEQKDSEIHRALIHDEQSEKDLFFYRMTNLRQLFVGVYKDEIGWLRPSAEEVITLQPYHDSSLQRATFADIPHAYEDPLFSQRVNSDKYRLVEKFFSLTAMHVTQTLDFEGFHAASRAFLNAGVESHYIISHALVSSDESSPLIDLKQALSTLGSLSAMNQELYAVIYQDYLSHFSAESIAAHCESDESLAAVFKITRNKAYLMASRGSAIDKCLGSDLGL
ncbi:MULTISPECIES: hypothetical protein [Pseudomonas]|uniref:hypothetical protein n=1 Tax=Pseudomonas TaxID=286 RepID=UPI000F028AC2|nr:MULTISPECIES: hypothetical protein [Pseudomonas]MBD8615424.1 hypothetical protein [Pseudomonas putida]MBD8681923.1 hypothetical protein [Pseudomonas sp. CFBP 13719]